jgi:hypothetical protein
MCVIACEWCCGPSLCGVSMCVVWQTADGWTPLLAASDNGHVEVVRALVGAGAFVDQVTVRDHWLTVGSGQCVGDRCRYRSKRVQLCKLVWCLWVGSMAL